MDDEEEEEEEGRPPPVAADIGWKRVWVAWRKKGRIT